MPVTEDADQRHRSATRRGFLAGSATLGAGALLGACGGDDKSASGAPVAGSEGASGKLGKKVTIGFSSPGADHGWVAQIGKNAK